MAKERVAVVRSLVSGLGLVAMLAALVIGGYMMVKSMGQDMIGGSSSEEVTLTIRVSGTPGVPFTGNYTTTTGSQNFNGTVGATPLDFKIPNTSVNGVNVVTVNVQSQGTAGPIKVEILKNGQVIQTGETNPTTSTITLTFSP